jgi:dolichol-phosphate mannosyltransferase/undecaprenyl-phosphate 4-deoxy-4-formamido-L-arabinose transferase
VPRVSIVIPVFNSPVLDQLAARIQTTFATRAEEYEVVLVDDCSSDPETWPTLERLAKADERLRAIQLTRNFGQQAATLCGLRESRGDVVITMDDDLQHHPEDIPKLLALAHRDIVIGQLVERQHGVGRRLASRLKGFLDRILIGKPKAIQLSAFRLLSRSVVDGMLAIRTPHPFIPALMFHVSRDVVGVAVRHDARQGSRSGYTLGKLLRVFSDLVFSNSSLALRVVGQLGMVLAVVSGLMALLVVYRKLTHGIAVTGWASIFAVQLFIGGLLLFSVGIVGEYLIRVIESSETRPAYVVRRRVGVPEA